MNSLRRQEIFETLRSRFGAEAGGMRALAEPGAATPRSASPQAMLHAGLHECLGQGPGDWASALGFALSAAGRAARERGKPQRAAPRGHGPAAGMGRIFVGAGREAGISPRDLVGAIANEAGVTGRDLGAIEVADRFSLVEVPEEVVDYVIESLRGARIRGRKVIVRRDRFPDAGTCARRACKDRDARR